MQCINKLYLSSTEVAVPTQNVNEYEMIDGGPNAF